ncbi:polysaccharide biosynthesis tyrosine autokinase [Actinomycetospora termitidis]|uniref:polysaccharide biosynthesis tyrosine autokinase n=1 Tax=Actinomycetospora termitidis TaxID=3053470 RepID=UPI003CE4EF80
MDIASTFSELRRRWVVILIVTLAATAAATAVAVVRSPLYSARVTLYVSASPGNSPTTAYQGSLLSQQRVTSYTELVSNPRITSDVAEKVGDTSPDAIARALAATSETDSVLIELSATDPSPERAALIANTAAQSFSALVNDLEKPPGPNEPQAVSLRQVETALPPDQQSSVGRGTQILLGVLVGLALGVGTALVLSRIDRKVRGRSQLELVTGRPVLAVLPWSPEVADASPGSTDVASHWNEAIRQWRTNLQFMDVDGGRRVVALTSSVAGEGKTTSAAYLAWSMSLTGQRVLLVEADLRRPRLARLFGLHGDVGLTTLLVGRASFEDVVQRSGRPNLDLIASGQLPPNPSELLASQNMRDLLKHAGQRYDAVVVDTAPLLAVSDTAALAPACDGVVLICRQDSTTIDQVEESLDALSAVSVGAMGSTLTMAAMRDRAGYYADYTSGSQSNDTAEVGPLLSKKPTPRPR